MSREYSHPPLSARSREFLTLAENCFQRINQVTAPILGIQNDKIIHDRTAVLYQIAGHHFALTAAHELRQIVERNIPLYLSANVPNVDLLPLGGAKFLSTEENDRDVAAIWLPPNVSQEISQHKGFLLHNQVDMNPDSRTALFAFFGYPMEWSGHFLTEKRFVSVGLAFPTFEHSGKLAPFERFDPRVHMVFNFTQKAIHIPTGRTDQLPSLKGISGCGIWRIGDRSDSGPTPRTAETVSLVGIQHRWFPEYDYVQTTRIRYLLDEIERNYPKTKSAMRLFYPGAS